MGFFVGVSVVELCKLLIDGMMSLMSLELTAGHIKKFYLERMQRSYKTVYSSSVAFKHL